MTSSASEGRLIERAQDGDPAAFAEIYDRYQPAVYRYITYRVVDTHAAEDLTSEVFVRVVEKIDGFVYRDRPLLTWLYTIARNLVIDHQRRASRVTLLPLDERLVAENGDAEGAAERALTRRRLAVALEHVTEEQRQVILLKFVEGMDNREIARVLGKSVGAVKALQHRALAALERVLRSKRF
jgi:RNA polymerase sigma-70 factor (ECF subfamily)